MYERRQTMYLRAPSGSRTNSIGPKRFQNQLSTGGGVGCVCVCARCVASTFLSLGLSSCLPYLGQRPCLDTIPMGDTADHQGEQRGDAVEHVWYECGSRDIRTPDTQEGHAVNPAVCYSSSPTGLLRMLAPSSGLSCSTTVRSTRSLRQIQILPPALATMLHKYRTSIVHVRTMLLSVSDIERQQCVP